MKKLVDFFHHFFIPRETNNYRAKFLHLDAMIVYLLMALCLSTLFQTLKSNSTDVLGYATDITIDKIYQLTNLEREKQGLNTLNYDSRLANAAKQKAENMFAQNYWAHYGPDGTTPWQFITASGYEYEYAGENLAKNFLFSDSVVKAWMNSPTHRDNILRSEYTDIGFAIANGVLNGEETTLVVQMFGTETKDSKVLSLNNKVDETDLEKQSDEDMNPSANVQEDEVDKIENMFVYGVKNSNASEFSPAEFSGLKQSHSSPAIWAYNIKLIFMIFILLILSVDFFVAVQMGLIRVHGKNLVHIIFVGFIIVGVYVLAKGSII